MEVSVRNPDPPNGPAVGRPQTATNDTRARRPGVAIIAAVAIIVLSAAGCGRSAPEGAAAEEVEVEPEAAGIQFASDAPIVEPLPTTTTATTTAPSTTAGTAGTYVIEPGDTLSVIAERFGVSVEALSEANGITNVDSIQPGQELIIPAPAPAG
ncbi:MAG: LysM domain-containing protein [Actinomycetota bacterium]